MTAQEKTAENVRFEMARKGKKTKDAADVWEITPEAARLKLNGTSRMTMDDLAALGQYIDVPLARFFVDVDLPPLDKSPVSST